MNESEFWKRLEFKVCRELEASTENRIRFLWCDGLVPESCKLQSNRLHFNGKAWIHGDQSQGQWSFTLALDEQARSADEINWANSLPHDDDAHGWLQVDLARRWLHLRLPAKPAAITN